jgi:hypothetical protein
METLMRLLGTWATRFYLGGLGLVLLGGASPEAELLQRLHAKLSASFCTDGGLAGEREVLVLNHVGVALSQADLEDKSGLSMLLDQVPLSAKGAWAGGAQVSTIYGTILSLAKPDPNPSMLDRDVYDKAYEFLFDRTHPGAATPKLIKYRSDEKQYLKWEAGYLSALEDKNLALAEAKASGLPVPPGLDKAISDARAQMVVIKSRMTDVDAALATMEIYNKARTGAWLKDLRATFDAAQISGGDPHQWFPFLVATPPAEEWLGPAGWKVFLYRQTEVRLPTVGTASLYGSPESTKQLAWTQDWLASLSLMVETKRVRLARPWLDRSFFRNQHWKLPEDSGFACVSTGELGEANQGILPMVITGILLGRNLQIKGAWTSQSLDPAPGKSLVALGPFRLGGATGKWAVSKGELSITSEGVQIIGYFCQLLPKAPNPIAGFR